MNERHFLVAVDEDGDETVLSLNFDDQLIALTQPSEREDGEPDIVVLDTAILSFIGFIVGQHIEEDGTLNPEKLPVMENTFVH